MIETLVRRIRGEPCARCRDEDAPSAAEAHYEADKAHAEATMRWADVVVREIQNRPSWEDLLVKERRR